MVDATTFDDSGFPNEAFACPHCGQMLGASCRVCVACKEPIDPAQIHIEPAYVPFSPTIQQPALLVNVRFPWILFLSLFFLRILLFGLLSDRLGLVKTELILGAMELLSCVWVFVDANRLGVGRPFRWALGTLLLWPIVFPWYLARRKSPQSPCPFVEGMGLIVLVVLLAVSLLIVLITGQAPFKVG